MFYENFKSKLNYSKVYLYLIVTFAFTMPLSRAAISFFVIVLPIVWFIEGDFKRKFEQIKSSNILVIILILYGMVILSVVLSENTDTALKFLRLYSYWIVIFVVATSLNKEHTRNVITAFLLGMFISEVIAYGVFFDIWQFGNATKQTPSPFMMHIDYSVFLAFTSILLFNRLISNDYQLKEKIVILLFFCSTTGNLFLSTGRTGQVAFIFAIIMMFFLYYKLHFKTIIYSCVSLIIIYLLAFNVSNSFKQRVYQAKSDIEKMTKGNYDSSLGIRVAYWMLTYEIVKDNPIFGVGFGDYKEEITKTLQKERFNHFSNRMKKFISEHHAHNQFLMIAIQSGLVGIIIIVLLLYQLFRKAFIQVCENGKLFLLFLIIYVVSCIADPLWYKQFTLSLWILFVGLLCLSDFNIECKSDK